MSPERLFWFVLGLTWVWPSYVEMKVRFYSLTKNQHEVGTCMTVTPVSARSLGECAVLCATESLCSGFHHDPIGILGCQLLSGVYNQTPYGDWYLSEPSM